MLNLDPDRVCGAFKIKINFWFYGDSQCNENWDSFLNNVILKRVEILEGQNESLLFEVIDHVI